jgi:hypothetical protein
MVISEGSFTEVSEDLLLTLSISAHATGVALLHSTEFQVIGGETGSTLSTTVGQGLAALPSAAGGFNPLLWPLERSACVQLTQLSRCSLTVTAWLAGNWPEDKSRNVSGSGQGAAPAIKHSWAEGWGQFSSLKPSSHKQSGQIKR